MAFDIADDFGGVGPVRVMPFVAGGFEHLDDVQATFMARAFTGGVGFLADRMAFVSFLPFFQDYDSHVHRRVEILAYLLVRRRIDHASGLFQRIGFVDGFGAGFVAFDDELRIVLGCLGGVALDRGFGGNFLGDVPGDFTLAAAPFDSVARLHFICHVEFLRLANVKAPKGFPRPCGGGKAIRN